MAYILLLIFEPSIKLHSVLVAKVIQKSQSIDSEGCSTVVYKL
jgi:hypothetical protein